MFPGQMAQVLFLDHGEPVAVMFLRPLNLLKDSLSVAGTFALDFPDGKREWAMGLYCGNLSAFVVRATDEHMRFILGEMGDFHYLELEARDRLRDELEKWERKKPCKRKLKSISSLLEPQGWDCISSPSSREDSVVEKALPSLL